jgi:peptide/nickel transport system permease protein
MIGVVLYRIAHMAGVLVAVATIVFAMIHMAGDPVSALAPPGSAPEDVQALREKYGLDEPLATQYVEFLRNAARGDFGLSWRFDEPARDVVMERLPASLELVGMAFGLAMAIAIPLGVLAGARPGGLAGWVAYGISLLGQAVPAFWLGTILILVFSVRLDWFPSSGRDGAASTVLPVVTLAAYPAAVLLRMVRASVQEAMAYDYVRTARAKGLPERVVLFGHVFRNAAMPVIAYAGVLAGFLFAGTVVVEWVFAYPGIGQLALQSVANRDLPVVLVFVTVTALLIVVANLLADVVSQLIDPRARLNDRPVTGWSR